MPQTWSRPVPTIGDASSATERSADPGGWAFPLEEQDSLSRIVEARRDIRRFRPDPVPDQILTHVLSAAHQAPSVGHSQPWRFVVVTDPAIRSEAAVLADRARLAQAASMDPDSGRHLLDLDLEGIREAPLGIAVCCDRRTPAAGVLGRATFQDADLWSCACAIQNLWLSARAVGLGVGWVTLFEPGDLARLVGAPEGVESLGWLCVGWPDERPPGPGLERRGWSERLPLEAVLMRDRWDDRRSPPRPGSRVSLPSQEAVVAAHDTGDAILSAPGSLGVLDRVVDKVLAVLGAGSGSSGGALVLAAADHPVRRLGVSAYDHSVTRAVAEATLAGSSVGAVAATSSGLQVVVVDAGVEGSEIVGALCHRPADPRGDLVDGDALSPKDVGDLLDSGAALGRSIVQGGGGQSDDASWLVALGEVGIGNTTVAAALAAALLGLDATSVVGLGAGADSAMVDRKRVVVARALERARSAAASGGEATGTIGWLAALGGPEIALLAGVTLGVAEAGGVVVLDGLATSVAALVAVREERAVAAHLVAGQRSRENGHRLVLDELGLEPLLDIRLRSGEGAGACLAAGLLKSGLRIRLESARTG
jgi:nicotinate-nucleotide--dimethylbenzimidazole phosphoribosyltransferase